MSGCECKRDSAQPGINGTEIALKAGVLYPKVQKLSDNPPQLTDNA
jgi:hypothetical protein